MSQSEELTDKLKPLNIRRGQLKSRVTCIETFLNDLNCENLSSSIKIELMTRRQKLSEIIESLHAVQDEIDALYAKIPADQITERTTFDNRYFSLVTVIDTILHGPDIEQNINTTLNTSLHIAQRDDLHDFQPVKLPKIDLPRFDGSYARWLEYRDTFESLVHTRKSLNKMSKFHYLRDSLSGEAKLVLSAIEFSAQNYDAAWTILCDRYNNPCILIHNHLKAIFSFEKLQVESASKLRAMRDNLCKHLCALNSLGEKTEYWDTLVIFIVSGKLDACTAREWEQIQTAGHMPDLQKFLDFLKSKANQLESIEIKQFNNDKHTSVRSKDSSNRKHKIQHTFISNSSQPSCLLCKNNHYITNCNEFLKLSTIIRYQKIKELNACINCFRLGHTASKCKASSCRRCGKRHNTLLHHDSPTSINPDEPNTNNTPSESNEILTMVTSSNNHERHQVLLATALVNVRNYNGNFVVARALLDSGSQSSFISSELQRKLNLPLEPIDLTIVGITQCRSQIRSKCKLEIHSLRNNFTLKQTCLVIDQIAGNLPSFQINKNCIIIPPHLKLADTSFNKPGKIDMLIGADGFWKLLAVGQHALGSNLPILQKTQLGWILSGPVGTPNITESSETNNFLTSTESSTPLFCNLSKTLLERQLFKFWELEECPSAKILSKDASEFETHFANTIKRDKDGRFIVTLPTRNIHLLGNSFDLALHRFNLLEKRLNKNLSLKTEYIKFMREYELLGHMKEVINADHFIVQPNFYLPHHPVFNQNSTSTKMRVVFDGSARSSTGISLNDCHLIGPTIQDDLFAILLRFRKYKFVITADIRKMYRQVRIIPEQWPLQRILWRENYQEPIKTFELITLTYGTASASYSAIRSLNEIANRVESINPKLSYHIRKGFYVDDLNTGCDNLEESKVICAELYTLLNSYGFELCKWNSNNSSIVEQFISDGSSSFSNMNNKHSFDDEIPSKTLGLFWKSQNDVLSYKVGTVANNSITKRQVLSITASIFDPLGLVAPCIIIAKIFMQKLWHQGISWDESLSILMNTEWIDFCNSLKYLEGINIPRCCLAENYNQIDIHGFCDASEAAYGACIYIVCTNASGIRSSRLICAKSKVAPLKKLSIPRLELCSAHLLAKLIRYVVTALDISFNDCILWSDSTIVLGWLRHEPAQLKTFAANRVATIQILTEEFLWRHVPSCDNPADLISRGVDAQKLRNTTLWWNGPSWLIKDQDNWPICKANPVLPEIKHGADIRSFISIASSKLIIDFNKFSTIGRLERVIAYIFRFIEILKTKIRPGHATLSLTEIRHAHTYILKITQELAFGVATKTMTKNASFNSLLPFIDDNGLIRVGGRLRHSLLPYDTKHPILLPKHSHITNLIFQREHSNQLHIGPLGLLNAVRQKYWPISGRNIAKRIVHECIVCFKARPTSLAPLMGQLPSARVVPCLPFSQCGIDYAGPIAIKTSNLRGNRTYKAYIALFVCMTTRAMHLELVTGLSTEAFIATLRRFISRRGTPSCIYSDNGSNFVGASNEIGRFIKENYNLIASKLVDEQINWQFIPPRAPHFGGLWEAGVKSVKFHLKRTIGEQKFSFEHMYTLLTQIEAILNSRPLYPLSSDPQDLTPLTPSHFLIGRTVKSVLENPTERQSSWQIYSQIQIMRNQFWKRWRLDYIHHLQQATKWHSPIKADQIAPGRLVIIMDDNTPSLQWKMGRIVQLHPGSDDIIRVVTLRTADGSELKRAVRKICPLPLPLPQKNTGSKEEL